MSGLLPSHAKRQKLFVSLHLVVHTQVTAKLQQGLHICAGGLNIVKIDKTSLIRCFIFQFGGQAHGSAEKYS